MILNFLENRWLEDSNVKETLNKITRLFQHGGTLKKEYSPFGLTESGLNDFRGLNFSRQIMKKVNVENADLSHCCYINSRIEKSIFKNVIFNKVDFTDITDKGNLFENVKFSNCKFNLAGLGYDGSQFINCIFEKVNFTRTIFVRNEFIKSQFIDCKFKGVDFNASSFENCSFKGKLEDVWFRGGYAYPSGNEDFGKAKKNEMKNVSFAEATLIGATFSNLCDLSTIILPKTGNYLIFNDWMARLDRLEKVIKQWPMSERMEAEIFTRSYLIHANAQNWMILNIDELQEDFGVNVGSNIIIELNKST